MNYGEFLKQTIKKPSRYCDRKSRVYVKPELISLDSEMGEGKRPAPTNEIILVFQTPNGAFGSDMGGVS